MTQTRKYVTIMIVILVVPYVASIFLASSQIGDVYEVQGYNLYYPYEDIRRSVDDGLVEH